jgi:hypothetical protein
MTTVQLGATGQPFARGVRQVSHGTRVRTALAFFLHRRSQVAAAPAAQEVITRHWFLNNTKTTSQSLIEVIPAYRRASLCAKGVSTFWPP